MPKKQIISAILLVVVIALLAVLGSYVKVGATADSVAVLQTSGMTCGKCSDRISTALQKVKGVAVTEVDVEGGWVIVGYERQSVQPDALAHKVSSAGFGSTVYAVMTPGEFKKLVGRDVGKASAGGSGCCGKGGCGGNK